MAAKIRVYLPNSTATREHVKRAIAQLWVRRSLAVWVERNLSIRMKAVHEFPNADRLPAQIPDDEFYYRKDSLPPVNPGVREQLEHPPRHRRALISAARAFVQRPETVGPLLEHTEFCEETA